ncbi:MAG: hypothetical protein U0514_00740, partial [Candidatus Andersenbacteria bacterium]
TLRADYKVPAATPIKVALPDDELLRAHQDVVEKFARVELATTPALEGAVSRTLASWPIAASVGSYVDVAKEHARIEKELAKLTSLLEGVRARLKSKIFTGKAPATVVERERVREGELAEQVATLQRLAAELADLG